MKLVRILAIVPLALMSLMNLGYPLGTDPKPGVAAAVVVLGLAGLVASYGLARATTWGVPAAIVVAGLNVLGAIVALVADSQGAVVGLVVSGLALALASVAASAQRRASLA